MIPFGIPWRAIGIGVGILVLLASLWWVQSRIRVSYQAEAERDQVVATHAAYKEAVQAMAAAAAGKMERDQQDDAEHAARIDSLEADRARIARAARQVKPTVEKPDESGRARVAVNPDWWLCVSTHVTRDPADIATCEARASHAGVPAPVSR